MRSLIALAAACVVTLAGLMATPAAAGQPALQQRNDPCAGNNRRNNASNGLGGLLGSVAGDWMNNQLRGSGLSSDTRRQARNMVSNSIACALSPREQEQSSDAEVQALNSGVIGDGSRRRWTSEERTGVGGATEVLERATLGGEACAVTRTFITNEAGEEIAVRRRRCQRPDGTWSEGETIV